MGCAGVIRGLNRCYIGVIIGLYRGCYRVI